jgi:hypothetical protein
VLDMSTVGSGMPLQIGFTRKTVQSGSLDAGVIQFALNFRKSPAPGSLAPGRNGQHSWGVPSCKKGFQAAVHSERRDVRSTWVTLPSIKHPPRERAVSNRKGFGNSRLTSVTRVLRSQPWIPSADARTQPAVVEYVAWCMAKVSATVNRESGVIWQPRFLTRGGATTAARRARKPEAAHAD